MKYLLIFLIFSLSVQAKILRYEVRHPRVLDFDYKTVCKELGKEYPVIVEEVSPVRLDCMGEVIDVNEFCQKKFAQDKTLLRGVVSKKNKTVYCQFGREAILSLSCDQSHKAFCTSSKEGCQRLKSIFAFNLDLSHYSLIEERLNEKKVNCYFETKLSNKEILELNKDLSE